jgi:hypothetical protein
LLMKQMNNLLLFFALCVIKPILDYAQNVQEKV